MMFFSGLSHHNHMDITSAAAIAYGIIAIGGGILGYIQAQSKVSLISGSISGALLLLGGIAHLLGQGWGEVLAMAVTFALIVTFIVRWFKTRKVMPAIVMVILGAVTLVLMARQAFLT